MMQPIYRNDNVARLDLLRKLRITGFQNMLEDLRPGFKNQIGANNSVRGNVIAKFPTAASCLHKMLLTKKSSSRFNRSKGSRRLKTPC